MSAIIIYIYLHICVICKSLNNNSKLVKNNKILFCNVKLTKVLI